jgi:hypothetical protein
MAAITLLQAQTALAAWLTADAAVATGQSYQIGDRQLTRAHAAEITAKIEYWSAKVEDLSAASAGRSRARSMRVSF